MNKYLFILLSIQISYTNSCKNNCGNHSFDNNNHFHDSASISIQQLPLPNVFEPQMPEYHNNKVVSIYHSVENDMDNHDHDHYDENYDDNYDDSYDDNNDDNNDDNYDDNYDNNEEDQYNYDIYQNNEYRYDYDPYSQESLYGFRWNNYKMGKQE